MGALQRRSAVALRGEEGAEKVAKLPPSVPPVAAAVFAAAREELGWPSKFHWNS